MWPRKSARRSSFQDATAAPASRATPDAARSRATFASSRFGSHRLERERRCLEAGQPAARPVDPELDYLRVRYGRVFQAAFEGALRALPQRDRMLLRLHYVDGLNLDRLGAVYRIHRATVARWRAKIRRALLEKTRLLIRESVGMSDSEIESVFSVVRGDMGLNLRRALA